MLVVIVLSGVIWGDTGLGKIASVAAAVIGSLWKPGEWIGRALGGHLFLRRLRVLQISEAEAAGLLG